MYDLFPHLGESVLERIIRHAPAFVLGQLNIPSNQFVEIHRQLPIVFPNTDVMFDGFSTIDLAIELSNKTVIPVEVKLGHTGLACAAMNQNLENCSLSAHQYGARVSGNILAVFNRYFDDNLSELIGEDFLHSQLGNRQLQVTDRWAIVGRDHIITSWSKFAPSFNGRQTMISLETICRKFGRDAFNELVESILAEFNYFDTWIGDDE